MSVKDAPIIVEAENVSLAFNGSHILDGVSFAVPEGRYIGIVGPNGGGKTTLLKILLGLVRPTSGSVSIFGKSPREARKGGSIGYVPQRISQTDFSFPATVEEVVWTGRTARIGIGRLAKAADQKAVRRAMETVGVASMRERIVTTLSGGERQRVFIARALAAEPRLLLLDEPMTGVDLAAKEQFYALLKRLNADFGLTILFVSHDIEVMAKEVDFVLALNQKLLCHCSSHQFLSKETLTKLYGKDFSLLHVHG